MPPVWVFLRQPVEDLTIDGYRFAKGSTIFVTSFAIGRNPRYFDAPDEFRPERWTPEFERRLPRGATGSWPISSGGRRRVSC